MTSVADFLAAMERKLHDGFGPVTTWMRSADTLASFAACLTSLGVERSPRELLGILYMSLDAEAVFSEEEHDVLMRREAERFRRALATGEGDLQAAAERAVRFHRAWRRVDVPHTLENLTASVVAHGVRAREAGEPQPEPPEETLAQIRLLDPAAEAEARRRFHVAWQRVAPQHLHATVAEIAQRAMWDAVSERVAGGDLEALYGVLREIRDAIRALLAHSERRVAELDERLDVDFLKQQADHEALTRDEIVGVMRYILQTVGDMHAPVDDADVRAWRETTEAAMAAGSTDLLGFCVDCLLPFLRTTLARLQCVYARVTAVADELATAAAAA